MLPTFAPIPQSILSPPPHAEIWMDNPAGEGKDQVTKQFWDPDFILLNLNGQLGAVRVSYGK